MNLSLRPHQVEVVDRINHNFDLGIGSQLLYAPTGFGKTEVAISLMQQYAKQNKRVAMMMDRIVLVNQSSTRLSRYSIPHGVMQADHWRYNPTENIQICSVQTLEKRSEFPHIDYLIIDECHVMRASLVVFIKDNPKIRVIGLTATPFAKGLGDVYDVVVGAKPTKELIKEGWLTPLKIFIAKEIDMTGAKKVAGEWSQDEVSSRGMKITGDIVTEWKNKTHEIFGKPVKTVVFCSGVAHGRDLERQFNEQGYNFKSISYLEDGEYKRDVIDDFSKPDTNIHGLIATDILTRGFDVPDVLMGVSARPFSKSFSSHVQQMGRVMRPSPGKEFGVWLDHGGNYLRFRKDWDQLYEEGVTELESGIEDKAKREPTEDEKKEAKCPKCGALWIMGSNVCYSCGHEKPLRGIATVPGELKELFANEIDKNQTTQQFYSELLYYARMRNFKDGWAAHKYKEKFGVFPRGLRNETRPVTQKMVSWIRSRNIAWVKAKNK
jgi:superfamily II DNA or RNA helicase